MTKTKKNNIINLIKSFIKNKTDSENDSDFEEENLELSGYKVELVDQVGGQDEGCYYHVIYRITNDKTKDVTYVKLVVDYDSYESTDWENATYSEVYPVKKTITVYEGIKT